MSEKEKKLKTYFLDDDHNIVDPDKAKKIVINEFDEKGIMIHETWGYVNHRPRKEEEKKKEKARWLKQFFRRKKALVLEKITRNNCLNSKTSYIN